MRLVSWGAVLSALLALSAAQRSDTDAEREQKDEELTTWELSEAERPAAGAEDARLEALVAQILAGDAALEALDEETTALLAAALDEEKIAALVDEALASLADEGEQEQELELEPIDEDLLAAFGDAALDEEAPEELQPSKGFLELEEAVFRDGYTPELVDKLEEAVRHAESPRDSIFALELLAYRQLFEPATAGEEETHARDEVDAFLNALAQLRMAADAGVRSAKSVVALLDIVNAQFPPQDYDNEQDPYNHHEPALTNNERQLEAERALIEIAGHDDMVASLAVAYRHLSRKMLVRQSEDVCYDAAWYYHKCAQENVYAIDDEGGERYFDVVRLSEEAVFPEFTSGYDGELRDRVEAVNELEYYRTAANNPLDEQYAIAHERLGEMHYFGDDAAGLRQDFEAAARHFHVAADQGDVMAMANYGMMLASGIGVEQNNKTAIEYMERAAQYGSAYALHSLGVMHLTGGGVPVNATRARLYFEEAVEWGFVESNTYLGSMYLNGEGVDGIDYTRAFEHFELAAQAQSSMALFNLGAMHYEGIGTPMSCESALDLFRNVALQPDQLARHAPFSLIKGYECVRAGDPVRAYLHFRLAGEFGDEDAQCNAAFLLEEFGDEIFRHAWLVGDRKHAPLAEAFALYESAAGLNDSEAFRKLGVCYDKPWNGVCAQNRSQALELYERAAELGDPEAAYTGGAMLLAGDESGEDESTFVASDWEKARDLFAMCRAAEFPRNMPCVLATVGMDSILAVRSAVQLFW